MISYARNGEDVILARALKEVQTGFYIDVGAGHPVEGSVTKHFYDIGWRGINITSHTEYFRLLQHARRDDINLHNVVIPKNNETLNKIRHVKAVSLEEVCDMYDVGEVHFLKAGVKEAKDAIESLTFEQVRPWICVMESIDPTTREDMSNAWEKILLSKRYTFVYFDGVCRYYVAKEHARLAELVRIQPNVFDAFTTWREYHLDTMSAQAQREAEALRQRLDRTEAMLAHALREKKRLHIYVRFVERRFWNVVMRDTRDVNETLRLVAFKSKWKFAQTYDRFKRAVFSCLRRMIKAMLLYVKALINRNPRLKQTAKSVLRRIPYAADRISLALAYEDTAETHRNMHVKNLLQSIEKEIAARREAREKNTGA